MGTESPFTAFSRGAAIDYIQKLFGGPIDFSQADLAVGVLPVNALLFNPDRVMCVLMNLGATVISVSPDQRTTALHGLRLGPNGGVMSFIVTEDGVLPTLEWTAVSDAAGGALYVIQTFRISNR